MSKPRRDSAYLLDLHEAMRRILGYTTSLSYQGFLADAKTQDAVIRNLQVIGEAAKKLSTRFKQEHGHLPWKQMAGMRDKIVHDYFGMNYDTVWTVARDEIPHLIAEIAALLAAEPD